MHGNTIVVATQLKKYTVWWLAQKQGIGLYLHHLQSFDLTTFVSSLACLFVQK